MTSTVAKIIKYDGKVYRSLSELGREIGVSRQRLAKALATGGNAKGHKLEEVDLNAN
jgi:DNA-binding phage protein